MSNIRLWFLCFIFLSTLPLHGYARPLPESLVWETNNDADIWANTNAQKGGTYTRFISTYPPTLRTVGPNSNNSFRNHIDANQLSLTSFHPNTQEVLPQLATHWAYGEDDKTVYYRLNPAARWSDGIAVTADDFLFTYDLLRSKNVRAPWYNHHYQKQILSVIKYDSHTLSITGAVARPKIELHYFYGFTPFPAHFYGKAQSDWVKKYDWQIIPNTGPYQISKQSTNQQITFTRKSSWWGKKDKYNLGRYNADKIVFKVIKDANMAYEEFEQGKLDSFELLSPEFWHQKAKGGLYRNGYIEKFLFYNDTPRASSGLFLNLDMTILKDKKVREALAHSLNFQLLLDTQLKGDLLRLKAFHTGYDSYSDKEIDVRPFSLATANTLLDEAGWSKRDTDGVRSKQGERLSIDLMYHNQEHNERWRAFKSDALKAGIELNLDLQSSASHYQYTLQSHHQISYMELSPGLRPVFWEYFHSRNAHAGNTNNLTNTDNPALDRLILAYDSAMLEEDRIKLAHSLAAAIHDSAAFIPGFSAPYARGAHWRWLKLPSNIATKSTTDLYEPFGDGGLFWIDGQQKIDTKSARKSKIKYPAVNAVFDQFRDDEG